MFKSNRLDFIETNLLPALKTSQNDLVKSLEQYERKFAQNRARLDEVRDEKARKREKELEGKLK